MNHNFLLGKVKHLVPSVMVDAYVVVKQEEA